MKEISISNKLKKELGLSLDGEVNEKPDYYVHAIDVLGKILLIIVKPKTYFSYTAVIDKMIVSDFDNGLVEIIGTPSLRYAVEKNKSELSRVSTIGKKYIQLIDRILDYTDGDVVLMEIEELANLTQWKFLGFNSPAELERQITHNESN